MLNKEKIISTILDKTGIYNVEIVDVKLTEGKSCVIQGDKTYYIGIDMDQVQSTAQLKCLIYHELGHIATNSLYTSDDPVADQKRKERSAITWAITHCVPFDDLRASLTNGVSDVYSLAEYFDITVDSAWRVLDHYRDRVIAYMRMFYGDDYIEETA